jgi:hypothetical protein
LYPFYDLFPQVTSPPPSPSPSPPSPPFVISSPPPTNTTIRKGWLTSFLYWNYFTCFTVSSFSFCNFYLKHGCAWQGRRILLLWQLLLPSSLHLSSWHLLSSFSPFSVLGSQSKRSKVSYCLLVLT